MMKKIICLCIVLTLCLSVVPVLASGEESSQMMGTDPDTKGVFSEGTDTSITITSYSDFSQAGTYYLKEGDRIAVIAPSALPKKEQVEITMKGLAEWGYVPVEIINNIGEIERSAE